MSNFTLEKNTNIQLEPFYEQWRDKYFNGLATRTLFLFKEGLGFNDFYGVFVYPLHCYLYPYFNMPREICSQNGDVIHLIELLRFMKMLNGSKYTRLYTTYFLEIESMECLY